MRLMCTCGSGLVPVRNQLHLLGVWSFHAERHGVRGTPDSNCNVSGRFGGRT